MAIIKMARIIKSTVLVVSLCLQIQWILALSNYSFPDNFKFGAGTSAFQVEGAWNEDGKGPSVWDNLTHAFPQLIADGGNGDVACDSYHKYQEDIQLVSDMGLDFYRFSLSWSRILPDGTINNINQAGLDYYNNLIDGLLAVGITPYVTMFNFDTPMAIDNLGGFTNESNVQHFVDYADLVFSTFGDRVRYWVTFNEPHAFCKIVNDDILSKVIPLNLGVVEYQCGHNVLKAHAKAYRLYDEQYRATQLGKLSMAFSVYWYYPETNTTADEDAAVRGRVFAFDWFAHPVVKGNYPQVMIDQIGNLSAAEGLSSSRLPVFTQDEIDEIQGSYDYLGINALKAALATDISNQTLSPSAANDIRISERYSDDWDHSGAYISTPEAFRSSINFVADYSDNAEIILAEHGFGEKSSALNDTLRINFFQTYLDQVLLAIHEDGVNVVGYSVWQMMDTFYFNYGEVYRFGLAQVDFSSANLTRTLRDSATFYRSVIESRVLTEYTG